MTWGKMKKKKQENAISSQKVENTQIVALTLKSDSAFNYSCLVFFVCLFFILCSQLGTEMQETEKYL